jgi:hypothetical membrane protein
MMTMSSIVTAKAAHSTAAGRHGHAHPGPKLATGGTIWILATLQYAIIQVIAVSAWHAPYSWLNNYISDLGNTACGQFAVPHGTQSYVCSPLHSAMNASFIITGVLTIAGAFLLQQMWPHRRLTTVALALWVIAGLGKIVVGLVPENTNIDLHLLGAFNIPVGSAAILLLSLSVLRSRRGLGITGVAAAVIGLAGTVLSTAGQFAGSSLYLGLGAGGMERVADYPGSLWVLMIGVIAVTLTDTHGRHDKVSASPVG